MISYTRLPSQLRNSITAIHEIAVLAINYFRRRVHNMLGEPCTGRWPEGIVQEVLLVCPSLRARCLGVGLLPLLNYIHA